jgi:PAS domain S-box-containing protein
MKILLIEDNPGDVRLIEEMLSEVPDQQNQLEAAHCLQAGLGRLAEDSFDVVLLDLSLPDSLGFGTFEQVHYRVPHLPIVVLTGIDDEALAMRAAQVGAQDYLVKGQIDGNLLARAIRYAVERKRAEHSLRANEARFRSLIENAYDVVIVLGLEGNIQYVSPSVERVLGYRPDELIGQIAQSFLDDFDRDQVLASVNVIFGPPGHHGSVVEVRVRHRDQTWHILEAIGTNLLDEPAVGGLVVNARDISERKRIEQELLRHQRAIAMLQERERLARELHDSVGQLLGYVKLQAQSARIFLSKGQVDQVNALLEELQATAQAAQSEVREQISSLNVRPGMLKQPGFLPVLRNWVREFSRNSAIDVEFVVNDQLETLQMEVGAEVQLIRIVQESLTNIRRHAKAVHVSVTFGIDGKWVRGVIQDDGMGFNPVKVLEQDGWHFGLQIMRERAQEVGGTLQIESAPGKGTRVTILLPYESGHITTQQQT